MIINKVAKLAVGVVNLGAGVAAVAVAKKVTKVFLEPAVQEYIMKGAEDAIKAGKYIKKIFVRG
jgi:hypothetical protein